MLTACSCRFYIHTREEYMLMNIATVRDGQDGWWYHYFLIITVIICPLKLFHLQFVNDGVFKAELNEFLTRELAEDGYSGVEVRVTPTRTEIIILATRTQSVLGEKGRRIRELTAVVQKRFNFPEGTVEVGLCYTSMNLVLHTTSIWIFVIECSYKRLVLTVEVIFGNHKILSITEFFPTSDVDTEQRLVF